MCSWNQFWDIYLFICFNDFCLQINCQILHLFLLLLYLPYYFWDFTFILITFKCSILFLWHFTSFIDFVSSTLILRYSTCFNDFVLPRQMFRHYICFNDFVFSKLILRHFTSFNYFVFSRMILKYLLVSIIFVSSKIILSHYYYFNDFCKIQNKSEMFYFFQWLLSLFSKTLYLFQWFCVF